MADSPIDNSYLDIGELVALTGLSEATIWRLKRAGKIPYYQPGGERARVKFPKDAIERIGLGKSPTTANHTATTAAVGGNEKEEDDTTPRSTRHALTKPTSQDGRADSDEESPRKLSGPQPRWRKGRNNHEKISKREQ